ncbi:alcohol o-acetyltransferase 1 [Fusarium globosum]|uniref:Alcohol o-acetyltransferase 1 n=1 Tax=Fusarium globosum TaxID=78864 RepID=A0A8H6D661_9HYPO|nr:alcohol o-acetyltransferase 1 [Fusarium globosum]
MASRTDANIIRSCGESECMWTASHALGIYFRISNIATLTIPRAQLKNGSVLHLIRTAVAQVMLKQPAMRVGIIGENSKQPQFVALSSVDFSEQVEDAEASSVDSVAKNLEKLLLQPWPDLSKHPGWHVRVFHEPNLANEDFCRLRICLTVHHAICDGESTAKFHISLVDALNNPDPAVALMMDKSLVVNLTDDLCDYPLPQEKLINFTADISWIVSELWNMFAPSYLKPFTSQKWAGEPCNPDIQAVNIRYLSLSSILTQSVVRRCREEKTTMTNLLNALCATSLARRAPLTKQQGFVNLTTISLRPWISEEVHFNKTDMSKCASSHAQEIGPEVLAKIRQDGDANVWKLAVELRQDMKRRTDTMPHNEFSYLFRYVGDWRDIFQARYGKPRRELWTLSNLGSIAVPASKGPWELESFLFAQFAPVVSCALMVNAASVEGGDMTVSFVWQDGILETELVQGVRDDLEMWLLRLGEEGKLGISS